MVLKSPNTHKEKEKIIVYDAEPDRISELVEHSGPPKKQRGERKKVCGIAFVTTHAELPHEINLLADKRGQALLISFIDKKIGQLLKVIWH